MTHTSTEQPEALPTPEYVMEQAQVFASAWSLYGSGSFLEPANSRELAEEAKNELAQMVRRLHARVQELEASQVQRAPLSDGEIETLRRATFSTDNPFCPCDSKTMRKAVWATERAHGITQENL